MLSAPNGTLSTANGTLSTPNGMLSVPDGTLGTPNETLSAPNATLSTPNAALSTPNATLSTPNGMLSALNGMLPRLRDPVLMVAQSMGMPLSTTHAISTSIMGVGCAKRLSALSLPISGRVLLAWVFTLPVCCVLSYFIARIWLGKHAS
jgi:hypothetical protein